MPTYEVNAPDGTKYRVNAPDGATEADAIAYVKSNFIVQPAVDKPADVMPSKPFGKRLSDWLADVPRQIGLTARYALEGGGDMLDILDSPVRVPLGIPAGIGNRVANRIGLPSPSSPTERIVGDASRLLVSGGSIAGAAGKLAGMTKGGTQAAMNALAENPVGQLTSAGAAGGAGGYVRETGGGDGAQFAASLAAGVAAPFALNKAQQAGSAARSLINRATTPQSAELGKIEITIDSALKDSGMRLSDLPSHVQAGIRNDVQHALKISDKLSPDAIRRLADYRLTGAQPTAATLTLDPAMVSQQKNLAKIGINSKDLAAQQLGRVENANNRQFISGLNDLGADTADDAFAGGQKIIGALSARNDAAKAMIGQRYDAARSTNGRSAKLDHIAFTNNASNLLDDALLGGKLPADVRNLLNKTAQGEMPLTVDVAEQIKTRIGELQRATGDMAERKALGLVRQSLDDTPLLDGQGQQAIAAFNKARRLNRSWMQIVEQTPALQAVRDGIEPDKFVSQFIVGNGGKSNVMEVAMLKSSIKSSPEAMQAVRGQIAAHLKKSALGGSADEVGNFSQSSFNKALHNIGDRKLALFFKPEEVQQFKAIGRAASYDQFQPKGSAVNNSNTAGSALSAILDRVGGSSLLQKIPMGSVLADPVKNIAVGISAKRALNAPAAIGIAQPKINPGMMISPAIVMQPQDDRDGLLFP